MATIAPQKTEQSEQPGLNSTQVGIIYIPEKEAHIGTASVGDVPPVRMLEIPIVVGSAPQAAGVLPDGKPNMLDMPIMETLRLFVGSQFVDAKLWEAAKQLPLTQVRIKSGALVEFKIDTNSKVDNLSCLPEDAQAAQFVANCYDEERLKGWLMEESRHQIRSQIAERLKELNGDKPIE